MRSSKNELSRKQLIVALEALFGDPDKSMGAILKEKDVNLKSYMNWLSKTEFIDQIKSMAALMADVEDARIVLRLAEKVRRGDLKAFRSYLEMLAKTGNAEETRGNTDAASEADVRNTADVDPELDSARRRVWGDG